MKKTAFWLLAASSTFAALPVSAATYNVSDSAGFQSALIQAASSAEDDIIILSSGTTFQTVDGFPFAYNSINGGNLTIKSETGAILDGGGSTEVLNLKHTFNPATYGEEDSTQFTLKNLTIQNGKGTGNEPHLSSGLTVQGAHTSIQNSKILNNQGAGNRSGAALYFAGNRNYTLTIASTDIIDNKAAASYTDPSVVKVNLAKEFIITDNSKVLRNIGNGGVIALKDSPTTISGNTLLEENTSRAFGVIKPDTTLVKIQSSQFINNTQTGTTGASLLSFGNYQIEDSIFQGNSAPSSDLIAFNGVQGQFIRNSRFINNQSGSQGIITLGAVSGNATISNSLFQGNTTPSSWGTTVCASNCQIVNSIYVDNQGGASVYTSRTKPEDTVIANTVFIGSNPPVNFKDGSSRVTMNNNFIDPAALTINPGQLFTTNGNITTEPSPGLDLSDNFAPLSGSVLIDAGTSDPTLAALPATDFIGNARIAGDNVDIGWLEYGSSNTIPVITNFEFLSPDATNLDLVQFRLEYQLANEGAVATIELKTDETQAFERAKMQHGIIESVFMDGGHHTATVKVTNPAGEYATRDLSLHINKLNTLQVIDRIEKNTKELCSEKPDDCGIKTKEIRDEGYASGWSEGIASCKSDPTNCEIDTSIYIEQGKQFCIDAPQLCGIEVSTGAFDTSLIPSMGEGWELFGTGQSINNLAAVFSSTEIVWARINGEWQAYTQKTQTKDLLEQNNIQQLQAIPANHGFWVKK